mmetsp:Transcript_3006/g.5691  ORF Transcript_3006/g.5691 Transcript_3006/m.5691 type:complete len:274 (-) Transcript_3006:139-960(-)
MCWSRSAALPWPLGRCTLMKQMPRPARAKRQQTPPLFPASMPSTPANGRPVFTLSQSKPLSSSARSSRTYSSSDRPTIPKLQTFAKGRAAVDSTFSMRVSSAACRCSCPLLFATTVRGPRSTSSWTPIIYTSASAPPGINQQAMSSSWLICRPCKFHEQTRIFAGKAAARTSDSGWSTCRLQASQSSRKTSRGGPKRFEVPRGARIFATSNSTFAAFRWASFAILTFAVLPAACARTCSTLSRNFSLALPKNRRVESATSGVEEATTAFCVKT